jgi:hypothetical protein
LVDVDPFATLNIFSIPSLHTEKHRFKTRALFHILGESKARVRLVDACRTLMENRPTFLVIQVSVSTAIRKEKLADSLAFGLQRRC